MPKKISPGRDPKGRLLKGHTANPSGRPKTSKLTQKDRDEYAKLLRQASKDGKLGEAAVWLCQKANDTNELFKITKEFASYLAPKKSSVKTEINQIKKVEISFVKPKELKTVEGEIIKKEIKDESK